MTQIETASETLLHHRKAFSALRNKAYFNFGAEGTIPDEALQAINESYRHAQETGPFSTATFAWLEEHLQKTREVFAQELGCSADDVALTQNNTEGCNVVLWGINWKEGDHLVLTDSEHNGVVAAAEQVARRKSITLTYAPLTTSGGDPVEVILNELTDRTRLVLISHVLWNSGECLPAEQITEACRKRGVPVLVDGAQSAGVLPLNLAKSHLDFYALAGHKWYCGPEGVGALYIRKDLLNVIEPTYVGWRSMNFARNGRPEEFVGDASRFEVATSPFALLSGTRAAIAKHNSYAPVQDRYERIVKNTNWLKAKLSEIPKVTCLAKGDIRAGLVSFAIEGARHSKIVAALEEKKIVTRTIPNPDCIRVSVHYLTLEEELERLVTEVRNLVKGTPFEDR